VKILSKKITHDRAPDSRSPWLPYSLADADTNIDTHTYIMTRIMGLCSERFEAIDSG
jgi:hypothetical protein